MEFIDDRNLGAAIKKLMGGASPRCAVAFWGHGAIERLFSGALPPAARIVCDLSLGATNPAELRAMGAPENARLRHLDSLHAKVYLSDRGGIVCSANASDNGIGFLDVAGLVEAGAHLAPDSDAFAKATAWFEKIWRRAKAIDSPALDRAEDAWGRRSRNQGLGRVLPIQQGVPSLLGTVKANPSGFRGIGFVFTDEDPGEEERNDAVRAIIREDNKRKNRLLSRSERKKLGDWRVDDLFIGWTTQDIDAWPRRFVCVEQLGGRCSYWFYERIHNIIFEDGTGAIFAERRAGLRQELGFRHGKEAMLQTDAPLLPGIFERCEESGRWLYENGDQLVQLLEEIDFQNLALTS